MPYHMSMCFDDPLCWGWQWFRNLASYMIGGIAVMLITPMNMFVNIFSWWQWSLDSTRFILYRFEPRGVDIGWLLPMDYGQNITWDYKVNE